MATDDEYRAAIARVKNSPSNAGKRDWELVEKAAKVSGDLGNRARDALKGR